MRLKKKEARHKHTIASRWMFCCFVLQPCLRHGLRADFFRDLQRLHLFTTPAGRRTSDSICPVWDKFQRLWQQKRDVSTGSNNDKGHQAFPFQLVGRCHQSWCFVAQQTSSLRCAAALLTHPVIFDADEAPHRSE